MRIAALYDIHGNLPALEAVLEEANQLGVEELIIGGDVVPGPMPCETTARLLEIQMPLHFIVGNGEAAVIAEFEGKDSAVPSQYRESVRWNAAQLSSGDIEMLKSWPLTYSTQVSRLGCVLFCHASARNFDDIFTRLTPEELIAPSFADTTVNVIVCGHTHMQFDRVIAGRRLVNAGSVGMPFGRPGAYWLLLGPGVEHRRTDYDLDAAAARVRQTAFPDAGNFAVRNILQPPSEEQMLRLFEHRS